MSESVFKKDANIYLVGGSRLEPDVGSVAFYDFAYVNFSKLESGVFPVGKKGLTLSEAVAQLEKKNDKLYFWPLADTAPLDKNIVGSSRWDSYKALTSCFISSSGAVIPRPFIPINTETTPLLDNGVYCNKSTSELSHSADGINWYCNTNIQNKAGVRKDGSSHAGYVDMSMVINDNERKTIESSAKFLISRKYRANFKGQKNGSFALIVGFLEEFINDKKKNSPRTIVKINELITIDDYNLPYAEITFGKSEGATAKIGSAETVLGSLSRGESKAMPPQCDGVDVFKNAYVLYVYPVFNGFVITSDLQSGIVEKSSIVPKITNGISFVDEIKNPDLSEYPSYFQRNYSTLITRASGKRGLSVAETSKNCFVFGQNMSIDWWNSTGCFAYCPLQFASSFRLSYYFIGQKSSGTDSIVNNYAIPLFYRNGSDYHINKIDNNELIKATSLGSTKSDPNSEYYKFDFVVHSSMAFKSVSEDEDYSNDPYTRKLRPLEFYGFIHVKRKSGRASNLNSSDGVFSCDGNITSDLLDNLYRDRNNGVSSLYGTDNKWMEYISYLSVQFSELSATGNFTLDKYAMMNDLYEYPEQSIGAVTFCVKEGPYGDFPFSHVVYKNVSGGQIFRGYAMEISNDVSGSAPLLGVQLVGLQKKLEDMKLIHAPFWDGNKVFGKAETGDGTDVLSFFRNYTGCDLRCSAYFTETSFDNIRLPMSFSYESPAVYFKNGTSCLSALEEIAEKINHTFILQPNGVAYFYERNSYGLPKWLYNTKNVVKMVYSKSDIISFSVKPNLDNRYNYIVTMGAIKKDAKDTKPEDIDFYFDVLSDNLGNLNEGFPWSRVVVNGFEGILSKNDFSKWHKYYVNQFKTSVYSGTVTVPGYPYFFILDKISIDGVVYYIDSISHSVDLSGKVWTTSLGINKLPNLNS